MPAIIKILWIDDEIELLKPFVIFLQEKGYEVDTASNGQDGLTKIAEEIYDLILLDEMMPGLDGLTTLKEIKKIKPDLHVVMVTKNEEEGLMENAIATQISDYLIKPINPNQIIMVIKKLFRASEIIYQKAGQEYSYFVSKLNMRINDNPDHKEWTQIYKDICMWDMTIDDIGDEALKQTHFLQKRNSNTEFCNYIEKNYQKWLHIDDRPILSFDVISEYVAPEFQHNKPVYFLLLDCLRLDQYLSIEPLIKEYFDINLDLYYSILPTATPYSRNSIFSGLLPIDIAERFPEYWVDSTEMDNSRNRNEHQLLDEHIEDLGYKLNPPSKYIKIFNIDEGNFVLRKIDSLKNEKLVVLVYNFLDLLAHHRSKDIILQETIPDEQAFRNFTKHWFHHSSLYDTIKSIAAQGSTLIITTDHGSMKVNRASQIEGHKDTSITIRYKEGKNLSANHRHTLFLKNPKDFGLPQKNIIENFVFAKDDYYFVYPNFYHQYHKHYNGTFQHGGISMEEMILPCAICKPKRR
jgi:CheY-like chemotaxis protein